MLKPPSSDKTQWIPKPGNPNFLIAVKPSEKEEEKEDVFEKPFVKKSRVEPTEFEAIAAKTLYDALTPLYQFVGMLEAESGKTIYYRYLPGAAREAKMIPINYGSESIEEFSLRNPHLSYRLVASLFADEIKVKKEPISFQCMKLKQALIGNQPIHEYHLFYPDWYWAELNKPAFRFILNTTDFGAMELAANELGFPLKDLVYSPDVNYMFAQFCAKKFISPKNNAYGAGLQGGQVMYRVSSGFNTSVMANTKWLMGCKLWFKDVYYSENPVKATDLDDKITEKENDLRRLSLLPVRDAAIEMEIKLAEQALRQYHAERATYTGRVLKHK